MTARDELLAALRRAGYSARRASDLVDRATADAQTASDRSEPCPEWYEFNAQSPVWTHTCDLSAGHEGDHRCPVCRSTWRHPAEDGAS